MIGFYSYTGTNQQLTVHGYNWPTIFGPYLSANTWTHMSWTFSSWNGFTLYVNGYAYGSTGPATFQNYWSQFTWLNIGNNIGCSSNYLPNTAYQGSIDEVYIHNRELSASDVWALANP